MGKEALVIPITNWKVESTVVAKDQTVGEQKERCDHDSNSNWLWEKAVA